MSSKERDIFKKITASELYTFDEDEKATLQNFCMLHEMLTRYIYRYERIHSIHLLPLLYHGGRLRGWRDLPQPHGRLMVLLHRSSHAARRGIHPRLPSSNLLAHIMTWIIRDRRQSLGKSILLKKRNKGV